MSTSLPRSARVTPPLPDRALLVAPTAERAAALAASFDDGLAAAPDDVPALLVTRGHDLPCVVVSGVSSRGGRLATVVGALLTSCPLEVQFLLEVDAAVGVDIRDGATEALRGLCFIDCIALGGLPFLRFRPAQNRADLPQLTGVAKLMGDDVDVRALLPVERGVRPVSEADRLAVRVAELERSLHAATETLNRSSAEHAAVRTERDALKATLTALRAKPGRPAALLRLARRRWFVVVFLGVLALAAGSVLVGVAGDGGYQGAALTAMLGLVGVLVVGVGWGERRARVLAAQVRAQGQRADKAAAEVADRDRRCDQALASLAVSVVRLEQSAAVIAASSVDTAQSVALLHDRLKGERPIGSG